MSDEQHATETRCEVEKVRGLWNVRLVVEYDGGEFHETDSIEIVDPRDGPGALGCAVERIAEAAVELGERHGIEQVEQ